jgi:hypothetical protein
MGTVLPVTVLTQDERDVLRLIANLADQGAEVTLGVLANTATSSESEVGALVDSLDAKGLVRKVPLVEIAFGTGQHPTVTLAVTGAGRDELQSPAS